MAAWPGGTVYGSSSTEQAGERKHRNVIEDPHKA